MKEEKKKKKEKKKIPTSPPAAFLCALRSSFRFALLACFSSSFCFLTNSRCDKKRKENKRIYSGKKKKGKSEKKRQSD